MDNTTEKFDDFLFVTQDTATMANPLEIKTASPFKRSNAASFLQNCSKRPICKTQKQKYSFISR